MTLKEIATLRLTKARVVHQKAVTAYNKVEIWGAEEEDVPPAIWAVIQKAHEKSMDKYVDLLMAEAFAREMGVFSVV